MKDASGIQLKERDLADWAGLRFLSDKLIIALHYWCVFEYEEFEPTGDWDPTTREFTAALLSEARLRFWPDGWWEDPSRIEEMSDEDLGLR